MGQTIATGVTVDSIPEQEKIKKGMAKIFKIFKASQGEIRPHFLLTGPSGCGKSHTVSALASELEMNFIEINAAQLTKEGTSGNSLSKALAPITKFTNALGVVFIDEFDKLFISGNSNSDLAHETANGVQNEFLKILESSTTSVFGDYGKYNETPVDNILFIFAGAFNGEEDLTIDRLRDFGIKTEFLGRVGQIFNIPPLSVESMRTALDRLKVLNNYLELFKDVEKEEVVEKIMDHVKRIHAKNTLGIRILTTLTHQYFINGGGFNSEEVKKTTFQKTLSLTD